MSPHYYCQYPNIANDVIAIGMLSRWDILLTMPCLYHWPTIAISIMGEVVITSNDASNKGEGGKEVGDWMGGEQCKRAAHKVWITKMWNES